MSSTQTYDNYYRNYYRRNKKKILARQALTSKERSKKYYEQNREEILRKKALRYELEKCQGLVSVNPDSLAVTTS